MREQSLLVVLAHPDDESFPIGGTLAKYAAEGTHITLISATRGEAGIPWISPVETAAIRERELRAAAAILGPHHSLSIQRKAQRLSSSWLPGVPLQ
jgi:LmbE family N-acetylglucosaminyl deacetylase